MRRDLALDFDDAGERLVPARLEFASHQPVGWIGGVILSESAVSGKALLLQGRGREPRAPDLVGWLPARRQPLTRRWRRADNAKERFLDRVVDTQASNAMQRGSPLSIQPRVQL